VPSAEYLKLERAMASINTEEAARRLARVILSDIELYNRERPKQGETLEAQIEEGRRLFKSRVTPELLPVFGLVLADRAAGSVKSPAAAEPPATRASAATSLGPGQASPVFTPAIEDRPTPVPSIAAPPFDDERTPAPAFALPPVVDRPGIIAQPRRIASVRATPLAKAAPAPVAQARPIAPPAHEIPIPVLTARVSIPRLVAVAAVVAATGAMLYHCLP
jgi:hypothetical protein